MCNDISVLIVDDDPDVLSATARVVRSEGYTVDEAETGAGCLDMARKNKPDLILLDVILPDITGTEICRRIKADPFFEGTLVILMSGMKIASADQAGGLEAGADGYIARPVSNRELKARVHAMVRIIRAERERDLLILELKEALSKIKRLSGLLPICMHCKKVRDDQGYWNQLEAFIQNHSDAEFSHSICQECAKTFYPGIKIYDNQ